MRKLGIGSASLLLACSGTVDAGDRERWSEQIDPAQLSSPQTLYEGSVYVGAYAVDETTLYALLDDPHRLTVRLVSCPFQQCARNLKTLMEIPRGADDGLRSQLHLSNKELFWVTNEASESIVTCPISGCPQGPRDIGAHPSGRPLLLHEYSIDRLAVDTDHIYWWEDASLMRCARPDCQHQERVYEHDPGSPRPGWWLVYGDYIYLHTKEEIRRVHKQGSESAQLLVQSDSAIGGMGVSDNGLFFATQVLTGKIQRCPADGCASGSDSVIDGQRWPFEVALDAEEVFWAGTSAVGESARGKGTLAACSQGGCEQARLLASELSFGNSHTVFTMNQDHLFWLEQSDAGQVFLRMVSK